MKSRPRTKAGIDSGQKAAIILFIDGIPPALIVGGAGAVLSRPFLERESQPVQIFDEQRAIFFKAPLPVQILDAQYHGSALGFGGQPCQQRAHQIAQMHSSAGGGCKPSLDLLFGIFSHHFHPFFRARKFSGVFDLFLLYLQVCSGILALSLGQQTTAP